MTLSQVHFLQRLTIHLRQEDHADSGSVSSAPSSADEEEFADESPDLPPFFLGVPILRDEMRRQTGEELTRSRTNRANQGKTNGVASRRAPDDGHTERSTNTPKNQNDDAPPPRAHGKIAQQRETSSKNYDIHLFIGTYGPGDWKQVKFEPLRLKYAGRYQKSNFKENMKRLLYIFRITPGFLVPRRVRNGIRVQIMRAMATHYCFLFTWTQFIHKY